MGHIFEEGFCSLQCSARLFSCHELPGSHSKCPHTVLTLQFPKLSWDSALQSLWWQTLDTEEPSVRPQHHLPQGSLKVPCKCRGSHFRGGETDKLWAYWSLLLRCPSFSSSQPTLKSLFSHLLSVQPKERKILKKHMFLMPTPIAKTPPAYFIESLPPSFSINLILIY